MPVLARLRRVLPALAILVAAVAAVPASAAPPLSVVLTPGNGSTVLPPSEIRATFNQCVLAPPDSRVELRSPQGTLVSVFVSLPNCNTIVIGPTETLGSGQFTIYVFGITVGGSSTSMSAIVYVDGMAPAPPDPAITHPINDGNRTQVRVTGTGEPGSTVSVLIDDDNGATPAIACGVSGQPACGVVGSGGLFNIGPFNVTALSDSPAPSSTISTLSIVATVTLTDPAGNVSPARYAYAYKDTLLPGAPTIDYPLNGQTNANQRWTVSGTAAPQAGFEHVTVRIYDNGVAAVDTRAACASGICAWLGTVVSNPGSHAIVARAIDAAGNVGAASATRNVTVSSNTTAGPIRPSIDIIPFPVKDDLSAAGVAQTTAAVKIKIDGAPYVACATSGTGVPSYSCGPFDTSGLPAGIFTTSLNDPSSNGGAATVDVLRDVVAPAAPTVQFTDPDPWVNAAEASSVKVNGSSEPFSTVSGTVNSSTGGTAVLFSATTDVFGNWIATTTAANLNDGCLSVVVNAADARGNVSAAGSAPCGPTLDKTAPPAPVIVTPAEASIVTSTTFAVGGTAGGGAASVQIYEGAVQRAAGSAASFTGPGISVTLYNDGAKTIRARSTDAAGNVSLFSAPRNFLLDAKAPVLASTTPPNGGITNPSGTVSATYTDADHAALGGCSLQVRDRGGALTMGTVTPSGLTCSFAAAVNAMTQAGSPYTATVQAVDPAGNMSQVDSWQFSIDATPPAAPVFTSPPAGALIGSPTQIQGTAEPGSTVQLFNGALFLGAAPANPGWSLTISFSDGPYTLTAVAIDAAGNVGPSASRSFTVDTTAPAAPVISTPAPGATVAGGTPVTGTAESGATVKLYEGALLLGQAVANPSWSITPSSLTDGPHTVSAFATDAAGNTGAGSSRTYTVDLAAPSEPLISTPAEGAFLNSATVTVSGTAELGSTVKLFEGATLLGSQTAAPGWSFSLPFTETTHTVRASATDLAGNVSTSASRSFTVDLTAPGAPNIITPASGSTQPATFNVQGTAERLSFVEILEGITVVGSATADSTGTWTASLTLADGPHTIRARQTDPAGNLGPQSGPRSFSVDAVPPAAPTIVAPAESSVIRRHVVFQGTGEAGAVVTLLESGVPFVTAPVNGAGNWEVAYDFAGDGPHAVAGRQTDTAGNVGPLGAVRSFTVDGSAPSVVITTAGFFPVLPYVSLPTPTFIGTAHDNRGVTQIDTRIVDLFGNTVQTGSAICPACGALAADVTWTYVPAPMLPGIYTLEVTGRDQAGNVTAPPATRLFVTAGLP